MWSVWLACSSVPSFNSNTATLSPQVNCCQSSKTEGLTTARRYQSNCKLLTADRAVLSRLIPFLLLKPMFIVMRDRSSTRLDRNHLRNRESDSVSNSTSWLHKCPICLKKKIPMTFQSQRQWTRPPTLWSQCSKSHSSVPASWLY